MTSALLAKGANVNYAASYAATDGDTALILAACYGHTEVAKRLMEGGADKTIKASDGNTALDLALQYNHPSVVALLQ